jgi:hypothetical protein
MSVWTKLVEEMRVCTKSDSSMWRQINRAITTILDSYSQSHLNRKLVLFGLEGSTFCEDARLASAIIRRVTRSSRREPNHFESNNSPKDIPYQSVVSALKTCLRTLDAKSAESIIESIKDLGDPYPIGPKSELYGLLLLTHARVGDANGALTDLNIMIEEGMKPR